MMLARVHDELCRDTEAAQRLVHLLTAGDRNVEVLFAAEEERRRGDSVGVEEWIREFDPQVLCLPGSAKLVLVLVYVLVHSVHREPERAARAGDRGLEAIRRRDGVVGQDSAIAPSTDAEAVRIGDSDRDDVVDAREKIHHFLVAPISEDCLLILFAAPV